MDAQQRFGRWLRAERGSQSLEAAGAALAAALIVLALLAGARGLLGPSVEQAFECAAAAIGMGGGGCEGGTATAPATANTSQAPPTQEEKKDCNFLCHLGNAGKQVLGVGKGIGEGVVDLATGVWTLGSDAFKAATGDQATRDKYAGLVNAFRENPWETTKALAGAMVEPIVTDWKEGRYGEAIGRGIFEVVSTIGGPKGLDKVGKLGKLDDLARIGGKSDDLARIGGKGDDIVRSVDRLPCIGAAPAGKGPGLAKPLANDCDLPAMPDGYKRKAAGYEKQDIPGENCAYCGRELTDEPRLRNSKEADHIVGLKDAFERGGRTWTESQWETFSNDLLNQVAACKSCNASKQAKKLFDEWAPPNITPQQRAELLQRIEDVIKKYQLE